MSELTPEEARKKAERDKADREKMDALGYKSDDPVQFAEYQKLQDKVAVGRITQQDALRGMDKVQWEQADKELRDAAKAPEKDLHAQQKEDSLSKDAARAQFEQSLETTTTNREVEHAAARAVWERALSGDIPTKTLEQDQELQKQKDRGRGY